MSQSTRRRTGFFARFAASGAKGGLVLIGTSLLALAWANSPWGESYQALWSHPITLGPADHALTLPLLGWINDGLMAVFFLLVGLELKRELLVGELASRSRAMLPAVAALGGMLLPAALYLLIVPAGPARHGWAIPMATDIAFALGVLTLLGPRVPVGLKVFLTALAVVDDLGAVLVIAVFYTDTLHLVPLLVALGVVALLVLGNRLGVRSLAVYLVAGLVIWLALHESGIHATLAGVALAFTVPTRTRLDAAQFSSGVRRELDEFDAAETGDLLVLTSQGQQEALHRIEQAAEQVQAPLLRLEHALQPLVHFGVLPLFALANAGVALSGPGLTTIQPVTLGILAGLLVGKPLGILLASWLAVRRQWAALPAGTSWNMIHGVAWLGGIGFTVSIFVAMLAFGGVAEQLLAAKIGILVGSTLAGVVGALVVRRALQTTRTARGKNSG